MAYTKHNYKSGEKLYASQLNEMDDQIAKNESDVNRLTEEISNKGYQTEEQVKELVKSELGVIENGSY